MKFKSEKRTRIYSDNDSKSDPEDSMTEYVKVAVLGSQMASKKKRRRKIFKKSEKHKNKSKSQGIIDTSVASSSSLSVNNALDGLSSSTYCICIALPDDANCTNEDSVDDGNPHFVLVAS